MVKCDEKELRKESVEWLNYVYRNYRFHLKIMRFHGKGMLTSFLFKKFKGDNLITIPNYEKLFIEPDIIGIINFSNLKVWTVSECKVDLQWGGYRQALDYANRSVAYDAYLIYCGLVSGTVRKDVLEGGHIYYGMNSKGRIVKKRLKIVKAEKINDKSLFRKLTMPI